MGTFGLDNMRMHSEAPAEGDSSREFPEIRSHSQDPAEGPDRPTEAGGPGMRTAALANLRNHTAGGRASRATAGTFELVVSGRGDFEFRLVSPNGKVLAVSGTYRDKTSAVAVIRDARECAAMALLKDHTTIQP